MSDFRSGFYRDYAACACGIVLAPPKYGPMAMECYDCREAHAWLMYELSAAPTQPRIPAEAPRMTVEPPEPAPAYADMVRTLTRALSDLESFHEHPGPPGDTERANLREYQRVLMAARKALGMAE